MANEKHELFFESMRGALKEDFNWSDFILIILLVGLIVLVGWLIGFVVERWFFIKHIFYALIDAIPGTKSRPEIRYLTKCTVFILTPETGVKLEKHTTVNLSPGGMFLRRPIPFALNTSFDFSLKLGDEEKIEGTALVRWIQPSPKHGIPPGMGCEFIHLSAEEKNKIRLWLRKQETAGIIHSKKWPSN